MVLSRLLQKYSNLKMNRPPTLSNIILPVDCCKNMMLMFPSEPLPEVIFNHGAKSQRHKCVSDYVVNYEIEILKISLNFSTKLSLFFTLH